MTTVAFNNKSGANLPWRILGFRGTATSGVIITSGWASSGESISRQVSGYDRYQFIAYPGTNPSPPIPINGDTQIAVVFAATE